MKHPTASLFILSLMVGCTSDSFEGPLTFAVDTLEGGTLLVENDGTPAWTELEHWRATEDLRIGSLDGGGPQQFGIIGAIAVDDVGAVYVAEPQANEIRVFHRDGTYSHTIGAAGEGPGEFRGIFGLRFDPSGNLWVRDAGNTRFSVFRPDGTVVATHAAGFFSRLSPWHGQIDSEGHLLDWDVHRPHDPGSLSSTEMILYPVRISPDFSARDTLPPLSYHLELIDGMRVPKPFSRSLELYLDQHGAVWFANTKEYRILRRDLRGDTTLVFTLPGQPESATSDEKVVIATEWLPGRPIPVDQVLDEKPIIRRIITDDHDHVLVFPHLADVPLGTAVDVFTTSGVFLGRVDLPVLLEVYPEPVFCDGVLYGVIKDEFDVPYVVRLRLGPGHT